MAVPVVTQNTPDGENSYDLKPTFEFTGTDGDNDDIEYNFQLSLSNSSSEGFIDSNDPFYLWTGVDHYLFSTIWKKYAHSFTSQSTSQDLIACTFHLYKSGSPTGNMVAKLYAHSGTYGTSSVPTGTALATSDNVAASTATDTTYGGPVRFDFSTPYTLSASTYYVIALEYIPADNDNTVGIGFNASTSHGGNMSSYNSSWSAGTTYDLTFSVITDNPHIDAVSGTDAGFANVDTPADTSPFNSGDKCDYDTQIDIEAWSYYWRVRGKDPSGSNTYGDWSSYRLFQSAVNNTLAKQMTYEVGNKGYSHEAATSLPTTNDSLDVGYTSTELTNVDSDNSTRVAVGSISTNRYLIHQFSVSTPENAEIAVSWNGQASIAPSTTTVYLQIYNNNTSSWETLTSNSSASADTDFTLSGSKTTNLSYYRDSEGKSVARVYQYTG